MLTAKLFTNGSSQAVRLPKEVRFHGTEVYVHKDGTSLMLVPKEKAWENFMEGIDSFTNDYFDLVQSRCEKEFVPEEIEAL
ncbi:type II toxin-antitoxin system VapB family antitoxin [Ruminococcus sp.]|jgi:antitoxin VapB|uniref:antitoxin n=1 Tax=Ruminococcus sp. TaxID=41978 RepID=UPI0025CE4258|nr:type II toxin-antitoxin system VapB family antitoxin [Ruminococcus sp.]